MARRAVTDKAAAPRSAKGSTWAPARGTSARGNACRRGEPCDRETVLDPAGVRLTARQDGAYALEVRPGFCAPLAHDPRRPTMVEVCAGCAADLRAMGSLS